MAGVALLRWRRLPEETASPCIRKLPSLACIVSTRSANVRACVRACACVVRPRNRILPSRPSLIRMKPPNPSCFLRPVRPGMIHGSNACDPLDLFLVSAATNLNNVFANHPAAALVKVGALHMGAGDIFVSLHRARLRPRRLLPYGRRLKLNLCSHGDPPCLLSNYSLNH